MKIAVAGKGGVGKTLIERDAVVMDMEAGLEHLGRATAKGFDVLLCVVEPGGQSIETASRIKRLADDIEIRNVVAVANKVRTKEEEFIREALEKRSLEIICSIPYDKNIILADMSRTAPIDYSPKSPAITAIKRLEAVSYTHLTLPTN